ncbi:hypothetical protein F5B18DRAFT_447651 [Nemania serpens]|nr:hypothetical protein F5B18DRAFT_447651 [Nemania serpens]
MHENTHTCVSVAMAVVLFLIPCLFSFSLSDAHIGGQITKLLEECRLDDIYLVPTTRKDRFLAALANNQAGYKLPWVLSSVLPPVSMRTNVGPAVCATVTSTATTLATNIPGSRGGPS